MQSLIEINLGVPTMMSLKCFESFIELLVFTSQRLTSVLLRPIRHYVHTWEQTKVRNIT